MLENPEKFSKPIPPPMKDKDGNPIVDDEGGATIQPTAHFVIKSKDIKGSKVFLNMTSHKMVDPFEEKEIPDSEELGIRIPLSLGDPREDRDK